MSYCNQCRVKIKDPHSVCPLCHCAVSKDGEEQMHYPEVRQKKRKMYLALRIYLAAAVVLQGVCFYINKIFLPEMNWSLLTLATFAAVYVAIRMSISNKTGYRSRTIGLTVFATAYIVLIDYEFGAMGWSINYVLPASIILLNIGVLVMIFVNRRNWQSYLVVEMFLIVCSCLPLLFVLFEITTEPFFSYLAFWISVALFACTVIVGGRKAVTELKRRFHI